MRSKVNEVKVKGRRLKGNECKSELQTALFCYCGVRQGGVLSPILFNIYIGSVIKSLVLADLGCHIQGT